MAWVLALLGYTMLREPKAAMPIVEESLALFRELNHQPGAGAIGALGQPQQAVRLLGASEIALERLGAFHQPNDKREIDGLIAAVRAQLDEVTFQAAWAEGRELTLEQAVAQVLAE